MFGSRWLFDAVEFCIDFGWFFDLFGLMAGRETLMPILSKINQQTVSESSRRKLRGANPRKQPPRTIQLHTWEYVLLNKLVQTLCL